MTPEEAIDQLAHQVIWQAVREVIDNGLIDSWDSDHEISVAHYKALRRRLEQRIGARPTSTSLSAALEALGAESSTDL
jgi:hypothetical protein